MDNPDLERLEALLNQFNIFEALGVVSQELRHSDFLSFLLDPRQSHGLSDLFLKRFLQRVLRAADASVSPIDIDLWNLTQATVYREWQQIDIFVRDDAHHLAVVIENKVHSGEHSNQLARYWETVAHQYPNWRVVGVLLTPEGVESSLPDYLALSYASVCELVEQVVTARAEALSPDVRAMLVHYAQMLRRHIVTDSEIADLCQRIYQKHQRALDLIFEHRPDQQASVRDAVVALIKETPDLVLDRGGKSVIDFLPKIWDVPVLKQGQGWTSSGRMLMFEFANEPRRLRLQLWIGPGPEGVRQRLHDRAKSAPFKVSWQKLGAKWNMIWQRVFLAPSKYNEASADQLIEELTKEWKHFVEADLGTLCDALKDETWIWESSDGQPLALSTT